jgi:hypothetical protein
MRQGQVATSEDINLAIDTTEAAHQQLDRATRHGHVPAEGELGMYTSHIFRQL